MDEFKYLITLIALIISFWSAYTFRRLWYEANRPIVTVDIKVVKSSEGLCLFDLVILNSGTRPALNIELKASENELLGILIANATDQNKRELFQIFSKASIINQLSGGQSATTSFFGWETPPVKNLRSCFLEYDSLLTVKITYSDISGKKYTTSQILKIRDNEGFGGSTWKL